MSKKRIFLKIISIPILIILFGCSEDDNYPEFEVRSPAFGHGGTIPRRHTCDGDNISPPLMFSDIPEETKTLAIILNDPDVPLGAYTHWLIWGIPGSTGSLDADQNNDPLEGVIQGTNSAETIGYTGPCPPPVDGNHHYTFKVYAIDKALDLKEGASKNQLTSAMKGHIVGVGELMGLYNK